MYEAEAMEAYNDYRRTGFPTMHNPNNATVGFVKRFPFAQSEMSNNGANVPSGVNIFTDDVWWAGGDEN
ncbi:MAG: SusD/RagB family nutrient-binding outer membrane lipoprotein [Chloroflexia bacterium]|nr:SusD/RagB family nutrient-binding outer membrane lipoprotein [Chloroflexia bacterium]